MLTPAQKSQKVTYPSKSTILLILQLGTLILYLFVAVF